VLTRRGARLRSTQRREGAHRIALAEPRDVRGRERPQERVVRELVRDRRGHGGFASGRRGEGARAQARGRLAAWVEVQGEPRVRGRVFVTAIDARPRRQAT